MRRFLERLFCMKNTFVYKGVVYREDGTPLRKIRKQVKPQIQKQIDKKFQIHNKIALANVFGHIIGDGCICLDKTKKYKRINYTNKEKVLVDDFVKNFRLAFKYPKINVCIINKKYRSVNIGKKEILDLICSKFFPNHKKTTRFLSFETKEEKATFLRAMFDDEGSVSKQGTISIAQKRREVIVYITKLFREFNISYKRYIMYNKGYTTKYHCLRIPHIDNKKYFEQIGFLHPKKIKRLQTQLEYKLSRGSPRIRPSFTLEEGLVKQIDRLVEEKNYKSRSRFIEDVLRKEVWI